MRIISLIALLCVLFACQDLKKDKQLKEIDHLSAQVIEIGKTYKREKNDTIGKLVTIVMDVEFRIRGNYVSDTIDHVMSNKINKYKMIRKKVRPIGKLFNQLEKGTAEELETLKKLKSDVENSLGERAKYDEYITFEKKKVNQLQMILDEMVKEQNYCIDNYNKYHKELYDFSWSLIKDKKK